MSSAPTSSISNAKKVGIAVGICIIVLLAIGSLTLISAWWKWNSTPQYWLKNQAYLQKTDAATLTAVAEDLEGRLSYQISAPPNPNQPIQAEQVAISFDEINAWLNSRADSWLLYKGYEKPNNLGAMMMDREGDNLVVAFSVDANGTTQVFSILFNLRMRPDGQADLTIIGLRGGTQSIPLSLLESQIEDTINNMPEDIDSASTETLKQIMAGSLTFQPQWAIDRRRNMNVKDIKLTDTGLLFTVQQSPRP
ncbi:hypothetical protein [Poriferisphaera sp. WC338]|uniref:hypothetical protein n=1 Tax=Poriferisphaera sp. WC338 TaxID=3425129 RepID=UPI003D81AB33